MTDVFISYSRRDADFVHKLHNALAAINRDTWVDWEDIPLSSDWWTEICRGIDATNNFLFVVSAESLKSPICQLEVNQARRRNKRLIPIILTQPELSSTLDQLAARQLDDYTMRLLEGQNLTELVRENWQEISRHNWLLFDDEAKFEAEFEKLITAIDTDLDHVREHTRLLVRAQEWDTKNRQNSFLLSGVELREAELWLIQSEGKSPSPAPLHQLYISSSRQRENQRQRTVLAAVTVALIVAIVLAGLSFILFRSSQTNLSLAESRGTESAQNAKQAETNAANAENNANQAEANAVEAQNNASTATFALGEAELRGTMVAEQATISAKNLNQALDTQTLFIADLSRQEADAGNGRLARLLALEGLQYYPDIYHSENLVALQNAFNLPSTEILRFSHYGGLDFYSVTTDINADGTRVVSGDVDGIIHIWDVATGKILFTMRHADEVTDLAWSQDGTRIASASRDKTVRIWDAASGAELHTFYHDESVFRVYWLDNDTRLLTDTFAAYGVLWDSATGDELLRLTQSGSTDSFGVLALSKDERYARVRSSDKTETIWDLDTLEAVDNPSVAALFSEGNGHDRIYTTSDDNRWQLLDTSTNKTLYEFKYRGLSPEAAWSNDGSMIAVVLDAGNFVVLSANGDLLHEGNSGIGSFAGGMPAISYLTWSPDDRYLIAFPDSQQTMFSTAGGQFIVWDLENWTAPKILNLPPLAEITVSTDYVWRKDDTLAFWGLVRDSNDPSGFVAVYDIKTGRSLPYMRHDKIVDGAMFVGDKRLLSWASDGTARLWDISQNIVATVEGALDLQSIEYNADRTRALIVRQRWQETLLQDGYAQMVDMTRNSGSVLFTMRHQNPLSGAILNPDESQILTWDANGNILLWDAQTGKQLLSVAGGHEMRFVRWNEDGTRFMTVSLPTVSATSEIIIWDARTGEVLARFDYGKEFIFDVLWFAHGTRILSSTTDDVLRRWNIETSELIYTIRPGEDIHDVQLSRNESQLLVGLGSGNAQLYDVASGKLLLSLENSPEDNNGSYWVVKAKWSPDESVIVVSSSQNMVGATGTFYVYDAKSGELLYTKDTESTIESLHFSNDMLLVQQLYAVTVLDLKTGEVRYSVDHGVQAYIASLELSPDATKFITRGEDVRVWDLATGQVISVLTHENVAVAQWLSNTQVRTVGQDGSIREWLVDMDMFIEQARQNTLYDFTAKERAEFFIRSQVESTLEATALPTLTASPTLTPSPTVDLSLVTPTASFTPTASSTPRFSVEPLTATNPAAIVKELGQRGLIRLSGKLAETRDNVVIDLSEDDNLIRWDFFEGDNYVDFVIGGNISFGKGALEDYCGVVARLVDDSNFHLIMINRVRQMGNQIVPILWSDIDGEWLSPVNAQDVPLFAASPTLNDENPFVIYVQDNQAGVFLDKLFIGRFVLPEYPPDVDAFRYVGLAGWTGENSAETSCSFHDLWLWNLNINKIGA